MKIERVTADLELKVAFETSRNKVSVSRSYFLKADGAVGEARIGDGKDLDPVNPDL